MILDKFEPQSKNGVWDDTYVRANLARMPDEDRFIISRINSVAATVDAAMKECQLHRATRELINFILEDLSRWYVQLVRPRMWLEGESKEKQFAYETIYYVMRRLTGLLAPFCPHITEEMYRNLRCPKDPASVHLLDWNAGESALIDAELEHAMELIRSFDDAVQNARQAGKRKLRWPVSEVVVVTNADAVKAAIARLNPVCMDRANARKVSVVMGRWERIGWTAKPVMKALGKEFGKDSVRVKGLIEAEDGDYLKVKIDLGQTVKLDSGIEVGADYLTDAGNTFRPGSGDAHFKIGPEHVTFTEKLPADVFSAPMTDATVYVDVALTPDLEAEGYAREVIRRIQEMRRQLDLAVEDFIVVDAAVADTRICELVKGSWREGIAEEVRAQKLVLHNTSEPAPTAPAYQLTKEWDVEGIAMTIGISKASQ
jgi:isoleucyl-tRNA synthetase